VHLEQKQPDDWRRWSLATWNDRLLEHYFGVRDHIFDPVRSLVVIGSELARVTGDVTADGKGVRDRLVEVVRDTLKRRKATLTANAGDSTWSSHDPRRPGFLPHLFVTLIAMTELHSDPGRHGIHPALHEIAGGDFGSAETLRSLWESLSEWLSPARSRDRDEEWRPLELPTNSYRLVGPSFALAFPRASQMEKLIAILHDADLSPDFCPPSRVLESLAPHAKTGTYFHDEWVAARTAYERRDGSLVATPLWTAVIAALRVVDRGVGTSESTRARLARFAVRIEVDGSRCWAELLCNRESPGPGKLGQLGLECRRLAEPWDEWTHVVVRGDDGAALEEVLRQPSVLPAGALRWTIEQGAIPLVSRGRGWREMAVRSDDTPTWWLLPASVANQPPPRAPRVGQWFVSERASMLATEDLSVLRPALRMVGGTNLGHGVLLGIAGRLPMVRFDAACASIRASVRGESLALERAEDSFLFPLHTSLEGDIGIEALAEDAQVLSRRVVTFAAAPISEHFKSPSEPFRWRVEGNVATTRGSSTVAAKATSTAGTELPPGWGADCVFLGPNVGQFVREPEEAAWIVDMHKDGNRVHAGAQDPMPFLRYKNAGWRRRWRELLLQADATQSVAERRSRVRASTNAHLPLMSTDQDGVRPIRRHALTETFNSGPDNALDDFVVVVGAIANRVAGITFGEWRELLEHYFGIAGRREIESFTRAWAENGLIDDMTSAAWRDRRIWVRRPELRCMVSATGIERGVFQGLMLPRRRIDVERCAARLHIHSERTLAPSRYLPARMVVEGEKLGELARELSIAVTQPSFTLAVELDSERVDKAEHHPTVGYEANALTIPWQAVHHHRRFRLDQPDFWTVLDGGWSYSRNLALLRARSRDFGAGHLERAPYGFTTRSDLRLPLPLARLATLLGDFPPGPDASGTWHWDFGTRNAADDVSRFVSEHFPGVIR